MNYQGKPTSTELTAAKAYLQNRQRAQAVAPMPRYPRYLAAAFVILYMVPLPLLGPLTTSICFFGLGATLSIEIFALKNRISLLQRQITPSYPEI